MRTECSETKIEFQRHAGRAVVGAFDGGTVSSDGGVVLLLEHEGKRRVVSRLSECFTDYRDHGRIEHSLESMLKQRVFGVVMGYEDLNDHDKLRHDPLLAMACGVEDLQGESRRRERDRGAALAGKSTLQRLETTPLGDASAARYKKIVCDPKKVEKLLVELAIEGHEQNPPERIVLDIDPSDIELYGELQEQLAYNGYYGHNCYLPMYIFWDKYIVCSLLRPSNLDVMTGLIELLSDVLAQIRERFAQTPILLRADSAFAREELMLWVEERKAAGEPIDYLFGLATNPRLQARIESFKESAAKRVERGAEEVFIFTEFQYRTRESWSCERRVIAKIEHTASRTHQHFLVTSLPREHNLPVIVYRSLYAPRGEAENRIKEQQLDLFGTRTSSVEFEANQMRVWFASFAYIIANEIRALALQKTELANARACTIREKLLKIGTVVRISVRRIRLLFSSAFPEQSVFFAALNNLRSLCPVPLRC